MTKANMKNSRNSSVRRKTKETDISVSLNLDGVGRSKIATGLPFLDHMLELFAKHGLFDLNVNCKGDLEIDDHHSVEDIAITLGQALTEALGNKSGINRCGEAIVPMDEALCRTVIDLSGRFYLVYEVQTKRQKIGTSQSNWLSTSAFIRRDGKFICISTACAVGTRTHAGGNFQSDCTSFAESGGAEFTDCWRAEYQGSL